MNLPLAGTLPPVSASPHAAHAGSVGGVMARVMLALAPSTAFGFWLFGWPAFNLWLVTVLAAVAGEAACLALQKKPVRATVFDGSAVLTGWLLAVSLPPWAPWWLGLIGGLFATVMAKQAFGGIGCNLFNPAMVARVALLISFPALMTGWVSPLAGAPVQAPGWGQSLAVTFAAAPVPDAMTSATVLGQAKTELSRGAKLDETGVAGQASLAGMRPGSLGESAVLLIAAGGVAMMLMGLITWHIPLSMLLALAVPALIAHAADPARYLDAATHLLSGGAVLGAFFIATDYVTSPSSRAGQVVFGLGCGLLTWIIRTYGGYPEGVAFAVLLMNALTPVIDRLIKPRVYGRTWRGAPATVRKES